MFERIIEKEKIASLLNNPLLLSLLLSLPFIITFLLSVEKYAIQTLEISFTNKADELNFWADLDSDGSYEQIQTFHNRLGEAAITIRPSSGQALNQWNLKTRFDDIRYRNILVHDLDGNGKPEIAILTRDSNCVFLNIVKPDLPDQLWLENIFIDSVSGESWMTDYSAGLFHQTIDAEQAPYKDLLISIGAGFIRHPRKVYKYSLYDSTLISTKPLGSSNILQIASDRTGRYEIILSSGSPANDIVSENIFPNDHFTWLMVLDKQLKFKFPPVLLGGRHSTAKPYQIVKKHFSGYIIHIKETIDGKTEYTLRLFDKNGKPADHLLPDIETDETSQLLLFDHKPMLLQNDGLYEFKNDFALKKIMRLKNKNGITLIEKNSKVSMKSDNMLAGYYNDTKELLLFNLQTHELINLGHVIDVSEGFTFYQIEDFKGKMQFALQGNDGHEKFVVGYAPLFAFRWAVIIFIYVLIMSIVMLVRRLQRIQFKKQLDDERRVAILKARSMKNLVDPHFTLNALEAISGIMGATSKEHAKGFINKFARMIHNLLSRSEDIFTTLGQEIDFVKDYLDLQQLRFPDLFQYKISIADDVKKSRYIPKIMIQTFAENSIRHGLRPKGKDGLLLISINMEGKLLKIIIEDNGIGRKAALKNDTTHTGTGLKVIYQLIDILKYHADEPVRFHTHDLFDENGNPTGTRVEVLLPEFRESVWEE